MAMAAPAQSPLRRWKRFFGAFDSVDAAIQAYDPVLSRGEFRRARGDIVELLCFADASDNAEAERLCLVLDDLMAESLETLRMIPAMPAALATTDLAKSLLALRQHESERVRVLAGGIVSGWRASMQNQLAKVKEKIAADPDATSKKTHAIVGDDRAKLIAAQPPLQKKTVEITKKASGPAVGVVRGHHHADPCSEEKIKAAKRKFQDAYKVADDAKRQRRVQKVVESPEMLKQRQKVEIPRQRSRAMCASSMVRKTFSTSRLA